MSDGLFSWSSATPGSYVNHLCYCAPRHIVGCLGNGRSSSIVLIDPHTGKQTAQCEVPSDNVVKIGNLSDSNQIFVADSDGIFSAIDLRSFCDRRQVFSSKEKKLMDMCGAAAVSSDGRTVAMGTSCDRKPVKKKKKSAIKDNYEEGSDSSSDSEPFIHSIDIWDLRNVKDVVQSYKESHSDTVQALSFSGETPNILMSGDGDGLVNIFDVGQGDEDDAIQSSNQLESSINVVGFLCSSRSYAVSDDNRFTVLRLNSPDDVDITFKKPSAKNTFLVDVLDEGRDSLCALFSDSSGAASLQSFANNGKEMGEARRFCQHEDLIRCAVYDLSDHLLLTGGEDGRICGRESLPLASAPGTIVKNKGKERKKPYAR